MQKNVHSFETNSANKLSMCILCVLKDSFWFGEAN